MRKHLKILVFVGVVASVLRVGYLFWLKHSVGLQQASDFQYLYQLACSLANGRGFTLDGVRIWNQSLGYPLLLSLVFRIFGASVGVALAVNVVLGGITAVLVAILADLLRPSSMSSTKAIGPSWFRPSSHISHSTFYILTAGLLAAVYPDLLLYTGLCAAENLMLPLVVAMACCAVYPWRNPWVGGGLVGLFAALAATSKALMLFVVPALVLYWIFCHRRWFVLSLSAAVVALIVLAPWTVHNYRLSGHIVPFAAVSGETFFDGNNPKAQGVPSGITTLPEVEASGLDAVEKDAMKRKIAFSFIREHPVDYAKLLVKKVVRMAIPARDFVFEMDGRMRFFGKIGSRYLPTLFNLMLYVGIALALVMPVLRGRGARVQGWFFTLFVTIMMVLIQLVFFAYSRYRLPFLSVLLPAVSQGIWRVLNRR